MNKSLRVIEGGVSQKSRSDWKQLLEEARKALAKATEIRVLPACIRPMEGQPRVYFNQDSIMRLADSIRSVGQVYPGIVRQVSENLYELLDGERRWRAVTLVGIQYRALLVEIKNEAVPFVVAAIANFNREGHTPLEIADSIVHMYDTVGMPLEEVAKALGLSHMWTGQMLGLRHLHADVRDMMDPALPKEKRLQVTAAIQISKMKHDLQPQLARRVLAEDVSISGLRKEVVRVSQKEGVYIPTRTQEPAQKWRLIGRRMAHLRRYVGDLEDGINQPELPKMVRTRIDGFGIDEAIQGIQDVQRFLDRAEKMLLKAKRNM